MDLENHAVFAHRQNEVGNDGEHVAEERLGEPVHEEDARWLEVPQVPVWHRPPEEPLPDDGVDPQHTTEDEQFAGQERKGQRRDDSFRSALGRRRKRARATPAATTDPNAGTASRTAASAAPLTAASVRRTRDGAMIAHRATTPGER